MKTICGIDCSGCSRKNSCKGCVETDGHPWGGNCVAAECFKIGAKKYFDDFKAELIKEFNALEIPDMPKVTELCQLCGSFVNLEYSLPSGQRVKLLNDNNIYLGYQLEKLDGKRCYGLIADSDFLLVCKYGCNGSEPEIIIFKKR